MKIKTADHQDPKPAGDRRKLPRTAGILSILLVAALTSVATYVITKRYLTVPAGTVWDWATGRGHAAFGTKSRLRQVLLRTPHRLLQSSAPLPKLVLDIRFKHMQRLYARRSEALEKGFLIQRAGDFVPASIRHGDRTTRVKLRLKGDYTDHFEGDKWSFRIHVKGKDHIFGMRRFSIQHPGTRGYQGEVLFFETLRRVGVLAPRYSFVDVVVNGNDVGVMALEEHFSKELLESNGRREGPIIRFDEDLYWEEFAANGVETDGVFNSYRNAQIDAFESSRIAKSETLSKAYATAVGLLRGFVEGDLPASEAFDAELMGRYLAVAEVWGSWHSIRWHNQRYYLNPITVKLEPIGFDADLAVRRPPGVVVARDDSLNERILEDPEIDAVYRDTVRQLAQEVIDGTLVDQLKNVEKKWLPALQKEFYLLEGIPYEQLAARARHLVNLDEEDLKEAPASVARYPTFVHAYVARDSEGSYLEIANAVPHLVEIQSVSWISKTGNPRTEFQPLSPVFFPLRLAPTPLGALPESQRIHFRATADRSRDTLEITANVVGQKRPRTSQALPYHPPLLEHPIPVSNVDEQLAQHRFLRLDEETHALRVEPGSWQVEGSLVVPPGYNLTLVAGTTLRFAADGGLISRGPLHFAGTENAPVVLEGIRLDQDEGAWQGVAVLEADGRSQWTHVIVRNTTGIDRPGWQLTGGVNFFRSDVHMDQCRFEGSRGEDALNTIHSKFRLKDIQIVNTASDGFDADFTEGIVEGGLFRDVGKAGGGDGVDISGSVVTIAGTRFENIRDKAISVGEQSRMTASNLVIEQAGTGAASKDGSQLEITDTRITQAQYVGLMAYMKKPEFGPAGLEARNVTFAGDAPHARAQKGSRVSIDGESVATEDLDVDQLYGTVMKPGLR